MKKLLILLFGVLVGLPALSQTGDMIGEITRWWKPKTIIVTDGLVYKYTIHAKYDTALRYTTGSDTFDVEVRFKKHSSKPPPPLPDIISTMDDNSLSSAQVYNPSVNLGDNVYSPTTTWAHLKNQPWNQNPNGTPIHYNKTFSVVEMAGAYVEFTCLCYKVEWWTEKRNNHGIATVSVDGATPEKVDLYEATEANNSKLVWTNKDPLTNATHKFRINYTGTKNAASLSPNIGHDKFVSYTKQQ